MTQSFTPAHRAARDAQAAGRFDLAERLYAETAAAEPDNADLLHDRGSFLALLGRVEAAEAVLRAALRLAPHAPRTRHALGIVLLRQGRYAEGWPLYDARHEIPELGLAKPALPFPEWRGEPLAGKRLLIFGEQGFGDQIMFARYARDLARTGAEVSLFCAPPLHRLFGALGVEVVAMSGPVDFPDPDYWVMSGSVAGRAGARPDTLLAAPYLRATGGSGASGRGRGRVGVVTRGNPRHANDANRSLPPDMAERLLRLPGAVNLELAATGAADFQATADLIADLDRVVTVDTAVAHLAGALGKPLWILLPFLMTDWRWMTNREDSPWYPTARLLRQPAPHDWGPVIEQVERDWP